MFEVGQIVMFTDLDLILQVFANNLKWFIMSIYWNGARSKE